MKTDYSDELMADVNSLDTASADDFCAQWKQKWRAIAVFAQSVLGWAFPPGGKVLGAMIAVVDARCS